MVVEVLTGILKKQKGSWGIAKIAIKQSGQLLKTKEKFVGFISALLIINIFTTFYEYFQLNNEYFKILFYRYTLGDTKLFYLSATDI